MEEIHGVSNWKLVIRREPESITILRAVTCDRKAVLPDELFGLPVTELYDHALSPTARPAEGEEVRISCGPADGEWSNSTLEELTLPKGLKRLGSYVMLNCQVLRKLTFHDDINFFGGGALMNCRVLSELHLIRTEEEGDALFYFTDELSRELEVTIEDGDTTARLLFPEYMEVYEENCPAHHFDYTIWGAGYPYHHCFRRKRFFYKDYDALWGVYHGMESELRPVLKLGWWRLQYPVGLSEKAESAYWDYFREHTADAMRWLLEERDAAGLKVLLDRTEPDRETLAEGCALAREAGEAEALAVLLEAQHRTVSREISFDL